MSDFECGAGDARFDLTEGWLEPMSLKSMVSHLQSVGSYTDEYVAGYLSVVYNPVECKGIALLKFSSTL